MATNLRSTVVGVFGSRAPAEQAVQALEDTGFGHDQIWYSSPGGASSFFEDIKSLFTGTDTVSDNLVNALTDMGLSDEEARYYANEYRSGHSVVAVRAPDREQEAMALLQMFGAFHYDVVGVYKDSATSSPAEATLEEQPTSGYVPHDADSVPEAASTPPMESTMEPASTTLTPQESAHEAHEAAPAIDEPVHTIEEDYPSQFMKLWRLPRQLTSQFTQLRRIIRRGPRQTLQLNRLRTMYYRRARRFLSPLSQLIMKHLLRWRCSQIPLHSNQL